VSFKEKEYRSSFNSFPQFVLAPFGKRKWEDLPTQPYLSKVKLFATPIPKGQFETPGLKAYCPIS